METVVLIYILSKARGGYGSALLRTEFLPQMMLRLVSMTKKSRYLKEMWNFPAESEDTLNQADWILLIYQLSNGKCSGTSGS